MRIRPRFKSFVFLMEKPPVLRASVSTPSADARFCVICSATSAAGSMAPYCALAAAGIAVRPRTSTK